MQAILGAAFLIIYWGLMTLIPVPGVGYANLEPTTNLAAYFDNLLLSGHLWSGTKVWDPEGILSTIPAISTALCGVMLGHWLRQPVDEIRKVTWIFVFGNIALIIGIIWDLTFPLNKSIWTSSYVMYTAGLALHFFAMCYWFIDIKGWNWWTRPFIVYGLNAITVFFLSGIVGRLMNMIKLTSSEGELISLKNYLFQTFFVPYFSLINASLVWAILYVLIWLGLMWILYSKKIFIKV